MIREDEKVDTTFCIEFKSMNEIGFPGIIEYSIAVGKIS